MFRDMRRKNQLLPQEEAEAILRQGTSGVLSLLGDGGYPYGVPLSYVYHNGRLYFHCAKAGHKLDAIRRERKCSFCVIAQDLVAPEKYTTLFRSVIAFGTGAGPGGRRGKSAPLWRPWGSGSTRGSRKVWRRKSPAHGTAYACWRWRLST